MHSIILIKLVKETISLKKKQLHENVARNCFTTPDIFTLYS